MAKFEEPFAKWPKTEVLSEHGGGVHITGRYMQPSLAYSMPTIYVIIALALCIVVLIGTANPFPAMLLALLMWAFYSVWKSTVINMFGKNVDVKVFAGQIQARSGFSYKSYNRLIPMEFRVEAHQKGIQESAKELKTGRRQKSIYRNAIEVVMQYGEIRVPLAEMELTDIERAKALVFRLQLASQKFEQLKKATEYITGAKSDGDFGPAPEVR